MFSTCKILVKILCFYTLNIFMNLLEVHAVIASVQVAQTDALSSMVDVYISAVVKIALCVMTPFSR